MAFGILEDRHLEHVPGTALLEDLSIDRLPTKTLTALSESPKLKHATGANSHIVLVPQPSDDPRDPLNWPMWKREALFWTVAFTASLANSLITILAPGYAVLGEDWGVSVNSVASAAGYLTLSSGCILTLQSSIAIKYGRRPVFLVSALLLFTSSIWTATSRGLTSFLMSRVFQGFGLASYQFLVATTIGDIYFVHQRGVRVAIWYFAETGGGNISHVICGYIIESPTLGWRWTYWLVSIFLGIAFILVVLFVPETVYNREQQYENRAEAAAHDISHKSGVCEEESTDRADESEKDVTVPGRGASRTDFLPAKTFLEELKPWSGYVGPTPLLQLIARPFHFFFSPAVWFAFCSYSFTHAWLFVPAVVQSIVFALPPINFTATQTGLVSIGPLITSTISLVVSGPLCDYCAIWFARRNKGVYEPESRLFLLLPMLILEAGGYGFWALMSTKGVSWIGPVMMYSIIYLGSSVGSTGIYTYIIDVHKGNAPECFALINFVFSMLGFGFSEFAVKWVQRMGVPQTFGVLAGLTALCVSTAVPMYIYGKRARSWVHRHPNLFFIDQDRR